MSLQQCEFGIKRKIEAKSITNHTMMIDLAMSGISFFGHHKALASYKGRFG
jgi:hypothetical protein